MTKIAIIGTAGRDKARPMNLALWRWMLEDAARRIPADAHLVSGGAAWADHLAVALLLSGHVKLLTLHLPAPFSSGCFQGPHGSSASAANYYHGRFSAAIGSNTLSEIAACEHLCESTFEPAAAGYGGMFARNLKVARADEMLAYTFGPGAVPADGGTADTWSKCRGTKTHIPLPTLT